MPDQPGVVYNCLEDSYEKVGNTGYVVTGIAGEMWPIGEKAVLRGNRSGIEHSGGDYVLVMAKLVDGEYHPYFTDSGRIINGAIFDKLYRPFVN